jgi:hypothetical protein
MNLLQATAVLAFALIPFTAPAQTYPGSKQGEWIAKDFKFHTGEVMPELRIGYTTVGEPSGQPVLILHGTGGSANSMLTPAFAGPGPAARREQVLHHHPGFGRPRPDVEALRRTQDEISEVQL